MQRVLTLLLSFCCCHLFAQRSIDFKFLNKDGDSLEAVLHLPANTSAQKFPVVIFLVGSAQSGYHSSYTGFLKENFEDLLLPKEIAVCYFNKPGMGSSTGKWWRQSFSDRAADVQSCIQYLKNLPQVDTSRIGTVGHSQGGWIAQLAAATVPGIKFGVSLAGPSYSVKKQLITDFASTFICKGADTITALRKAKQKTNTVFFLSSVLPFNQNLKQLRRIRKYEPSVAIKNIRRPFLFLLGENDRLVNHRWCADALQNILGSNQPERVEVKLIEGVNHSFETAPFCGSIKRSDRRYAPKFQNELANFIVKNTNR